MEIKRYNRDEDLLTWNTFVDTSRNGTFLLHRGFMDYHSDRFADHSLLFYEKGVLIALLPANISDTTLYSHQGLTYGGLIVAKSTRTGSVINVFEALSEYLRTSGITTLVYKCIPHIYHKQGAEEDLYALFKLGATLCSRAISSVINKDSKLEYSTLRKRQISKAQNAGVVVVESEDKYPDFWNILNVNLKNRFKVESVHSLCEIETLKAAFPSNIRLFTAIKSEEVIAGVLVFETDTVAHIQYISANEDGKKLGALDLLFDYLISVVFKDKKYFDFGISTENNGLYLNEGLISQKEGFGARGVVYDSYILEI